MITMQQNGMQDNIWDCIVVGAGIEGSNTARYSASLGKKTLCLEQVCCSQLVIVRLKHSLSMSSDTCFVIKCAH